MKIAYLGPEGTFTEKASRQIFRNNKNAEFIPTQPIRNVVMSVENEKADFAVVPLENFYNGEIRETLDSLNDCLYTRIIAESDFEIIHCLGILGGCKKIEKVFSKDQALEQCAKYLCKNYPAAKTIAAASTSEAVNIVKDGKMIDSAVIAQRQALKKAGFRIIEENLCPKNKTRFVILSRNLQTKPTRDDKTLISIHPPMQDKPGVLYNSLGFFCNFGINLEDIKSRPDGKSGYYFYIELDGHQEDEAVKLALKSIKFYLDPANKHPRTIKVLGSYKNTHWKD